MHPPPPTSKKRGIQHLAFGRVISLIVVWTEMDGRRPQDCLSCNRTKNHCSCQESTFRRAAAATNCTHPVSSTHTHTHTRLRSLIDVLINITSHATSYYRLHNMHALRHCIYHRPFPSLGLFTSAMPNFFLDLSSCLADK